MTTEVDNVRQMHGTKHSITARRFAPQDRDTGPIKATRNRIYFCPRPGQRHRRNWARLVHGEQCYGAFGTRSRHIASEPRPRRIGDREARRSRNGRLVA